MTKQLAYKGFLWNTFGTIIYMGCQWLLTVIVTRMLGYADGGILSLSMTLANVFSAIALFGVRNFQVSDIEHVFRVNEYLIMRLITCVGSFGLCIIFVLLNQYEFATASAIAIYTLFKLNEAGADVLHGIFQQHGRLDYAGKSYFMRGGISLLLFTLTVLLTNNLVTAITVMAIGAYGVLICFDFAHIKKIVGYFEPPSRHSVTQLFLQCTPLVWYGLLLTVIASVPKYWLENIWGTELTGYYAAATVPAVIIQLLANCIFTPFITPFSKLYQKHDKRGFIRLLLKMVALISGLSVVGLIGVNLFGHAILSLIFGNEIGNYSFLLEGAVLASILLGVIWFICSLLTILRCHRILVLSNTLAMLFSLIISPVLIQMEGIEGVNWVLNLTFSADALILAVSLILALSKI